MQRIESRHSAQGGFTHAKIDGHYEMLVEHPFDSTIKRMATAWEFIPEDPSAEAKDYDILICKSISRTIYLFTPCPLELFPRRYEGCC